MQPAKMPPAGLLPYTCLRNIIVRLFPQTRVSDVVACMTENTSVISSAPGTPDTPSAPTGAAGPRVYDRAAAVYERLVVQEGQNRWTAEWLMVRLVRAQMLLKAGRTAEAVSEARGAYALWRHLRPPAQTAEVLSRTDQWARRVFGNLLDGAHPAQALCRGRVWELQGNKPQAIAEYDLGLAEFPDDAELLLAKGTAEAVLGQIPEAMATIERGIHVHPGHAGLWAAKAIILCGALRRFQESLEYYDRALSLAPRMLIAWRNKGQALRALGRFAESLDCFAMALHIAPDSPDLARLQTAALTALDEAHKGPAGGSGGIAT